MAFLAYLRFLGELPSETTLPEGLRQEPQTLILPHCARARYVPALSASDFPNRRGEKEEGLIHE
jgi:hypothetical protein